MRQDNNDKKLYNFINTKLEYTDEDVDHRIWIGLLIKLFCHHDDKKVLWWQKIVCKYLSNNVNKANNFYKANH